LTDGKVVTYNYDNNNNITSVISPGVIYTYPQYDARNRPLAFNTQLDENTFNFSYTYDTFGRMTSITYPGRTSPVQYNYDALNRIQNIPQFVTSCSYDEANRPTRMIYANGINNSWAYTYDRLATIDVGNNGSLLLLNYFYDNVGNITQINNEYYQYDGLNRLTWAGDSSISGTGNGTAWNYDPAGNMLIKEGYLDGASQGSIGFTYDLANRLWAMGSNTYANDSAGNRTAKTDNDIWGYIYDGENRLTQVTKNSVNLIDNSYDGFGMKIKDVKNGETTYYIFQGNNPLMEYSLGDNKYKYFIYAGNQMVAEEKNAVVKYYHYDHLGSTRLITDDSGNNVAEYKFKPYGEIDIHTGNDVKYGFTGKENDADTGLIYFGARFYDPEAGRFITLDPIKAGSNWFEYCRDNPINLIDPMGLDVSAPGCDGHGENSGYNSYQTISYNSDGKGGFSVNYNTTSSNGRQTISTYNFNSEGNKTSIVNASYSKSGKLLGAETVQFFTTGDNKTYSVIDTYNEDGKKVYHEDNNPYHSNAWMDTAAFASKKVGAFGLRYAAVKNLGTTFLGQLPLVGKYFTKTTPGPFFVITTVLFTPSECE
jgi:RHS repeat-associated protein